MQNEIFSVKKRVNIYFLDKMQRKKKNIMPLPIVNNNNNFNKVLINNIFLNLEFKNLFVKFAEK